MELLSEMDKTEIIRWILTVIVGGAGWAVALGRQIITAKVIEEASRIFVKQDIHNLEIRNIQASIAALQLEQKTNHADLIARLDKSFDQINKQIELLTQ